MQGIDSKETTVATVLNPHCGASVLLICDHASNKIPTEFNNLGVDQEARQSHIAWDIGAAEVTSVIAGQLNITAVLATTSRLVIDCNRQPDAADIIAEMPHNIAVPENLGLDSQQRESRFQRFYYPYHDIIDRQLRNSNAAVVVSIHSFDHDLDRLARDFDIGILFDEGELLAHSFAQQLERLGFQVRLNEPYSGRAAVISSAQRHGRKYQLLNYEIEINQRLLSSTAQAIDLGNRLVPAIAWLGKAAQQ